MPVYSIKCNSCDYKNEWVCTIDEYFNRLGNDCPECTNKTLYQDVGDRKELSFILKGGGWTRKVCVKKGSQDELDSVLREHDDLSEEGRKKSGITRRTAVDFANKHKDEL